MKIIDLSHMMRVDMPVFPGDEKPEFRSAATIENDGYRETSLSLFSHTGTHIDAPAHMIRGGRYLDEFGVESFIGPGLVIDLRNREGPVKPDLFRPHLQELKDASFLLFATGWSRYWDTPDYFRNYPYLSASAADYLTGCNLKGIGIDAISIDKDDSPHFPVHTAFLRQDILIIENLTNLESLLGIDFIFSCLPLKYRRADGSPVRAVAVPTDRSASAAGTEDQP